METVVGVIRSYPIFLWITGCKILFIVSDQFRKTSSPDSPGRAKTGKKPIKIIALVCLSKNR
ncbi:hypothetical protein [Trabulsiella odontotermitis]|uniref:hypothetical protein n=1 Tax=Trabulsiella odontotermitis TaxID=379893 RepID=UPI003B75BAC6